MTTTIPITLSPVERLAQPRDAELWRPLNAGRVACDLCYRRCTLDDGQAGPCKVRRNTGGQLTTHNYGVLSTFGQTVLGFAISLAYRPNVRVLSVGGTNCTSVCSFCMTDLVVFAPDRLPLANWHEQRAGWYRALGAVPPASLLAAARRYHLGGVLLWDNEPTLTIEYSLDVARLAKAAGMHVSVATNGYSTPEAVALLGPFVDAVTVSFKGSNEEAFSARHIRSPGAGPAARAGALAWKQAGVHLSIADVIPPARMQDEATAAAAQSDLYAWVAAELGPDTPLMLPPMLYPTVHAESYQLMDRARAFDGGAAERARVAGLRYVTDAQELRCADCGGYLVYTTPGTPHKPGTPYAYVTRDGRCERCNAPTPVVHPAAPVRPAPAT